MSLEPDGDVEWGRVVTDADPREPSLLVLVLSQWAGLLGVVVGLVLAKCL